MASPFGPRTCEGAPVALVLAGVVQAGQLPSRAVAPGEAVGIMTGAPVPPGADAVVPVEQSRSLGHDRVEIRAPAQAGQHIARQGSEIRLGDIVLRAGTPGRPCGRGGAGHRWEA